MSALTPIADIRPQPRNVAFWRWSQPIDATLILNGRDGVCCDGSKISSRFHCGRENGVVGSLAARGVAECDWAGVWQVVIVYLFPVGTARGDSSCAPASLEIGIDAFGARGDIQRYCGVSVDAIDG